MHKNPTEAWFLKLLRTGYFKWLTDLLPFFHPLSESASAFTPRKSHTYGSFSHFSLKHKNIQVWLDHYTPYPGEAEGIMARPELFFPATAAGCCWMPAALRPASELPVSAAGPQLGRAGRVCPCCHCMLPVAVGHASPRLASVLHPVGDGFVNSTHSAGSVFSHFSKKHPSESIFRVTSFLLTSPGALHKEEVSGMRIKPFSFWSF